MGGMRADGHRHLYAGYGGLSCEAVDNEIGNRSGWPTITLKIKPIIYSVVTLIGAVWVYRLLMSGGWLTHHYDLRDPDSINLLLAILEPLVVLCIIGYWIWRTRLLYRLLFISFIVQLLIDVGFIVFIGLFVLTYKPRMM